MRATCRDTLLKFSLIFELYFLRLLFTLLCLLYCHFTSSRFSAFGDFCAEVRRSAPNCAEILLRAYGRAHSPSSDRVYKEGNCHNYLDLEKTNKIVSFGSCVSITKPRSPQPSQGYHSGEDLRVIQTLIPLAPIFVALPLQIWCQRKIWCRETRDCVKERVTC